MDDDMTDMEFVVATLATYERAVALSQRHGVYVAWGRIEAALTVCEQIARIGGQPGFATKCADRAADCRSRMS